jgi:hypothetical protein
MYKWFVLSVLLLTMAARAEILEMKSPEELSAYFEENTSLEKNDLLLFDIDGVLTMPKDAVFSLPTLKQYKPEFAAFMKTLSATEKDLALLYMVIESPQIPSSEKMVELVRTLQRRDFKILGLTALVTGSFERIANVVEWRAFSLGMAGYDLMPKSYSYMHDHALGDLKKYLGAYPAYCKGILFSNGSYGPITKGGVLIKFLETVLHRPQQIIFVDDRYSNIVEVEKELKKILPHITFTGIHYTAAYKIDVPPVSRSDFLKKLSELKKEIARNRRD